MIQFIFKQTEISYGFLTESKSNESFMIYDIKSWVNK